MATHVQQMSVPESAIPTAAEKRDLLERLFARLAHEIRNPLSSLDVHFQLLEEDLGTVAPQAKDMVAARFDIIKGELHRLNRIVQQFLRLAGPSAVDLEPTEPASVMRHVCQLLEPEARTREIELQLIEQSALPRVQADPVRLTQALVNLVINAIQAIGRGGRIAVSGTQVREVLAIEVADTGPGIPEDKLSCIFDPYFTTKPDGHGLGLWIAQQIVDAHGGTLLARNLPQGGAAFAIMLPVRPVGEPGVPQG